MKPRKFGRGFLRPLAATLIMVSACGDGDTGMGPSGQAGEDTITLSRSTATDPATWTPIDVTDELQCSQPAPDPTRGVTDTSIKVGGLGTLSNAGTGTYQEAEQGARARFERENAAGGVFGRKIDFIGVSDDGFNAQQNADAGRKLAENEKVFAVAPITTLFPNYADALCKYVVPGFGLAFNTGMCNRANLFGYTGCLHPEKYNSVAAGPFVELLKDSADKSVMLVSNDSSPAIKGVGNAVAGLSHAGLEIIDTYTKLQFGQPPADPSTLVRRIMTAHDGKPPAMVYYLSDFPNVAAASQALAAAGYEGIQISGSIYDPRSAGVPALDDTYSFFYWLPFQASGNATVEQMTTDLRKYSADAALSLSSAMGWLSADMLIEGLKATGADLTVDTFLATLNSPDFHYGDGFFNGVTTWPENHFYAAPCASATRLKDGEFRMVVPLTCNDPFIP